MEEVENQPRGYILKELSHKCEERAIPILEMAIQSELLQAALVRDDFKEAEKKFPAVKKPLDYIIKKGILSKEEAGYFKKRLDDMQQGLEERDKLKALWAGEMITTDGIYAALDKAVVCECQSKKGASD